MYKWNKLKINISFFQFFYWMLDQIIAFQLILLNFKLNTFS